jgi:hypothetical protein
VSLDALVGEWRTEVNLPNGGAWEWFRDGAWQHDFELVYRRVT